MIRYDSNNIFESGRTGGQKLKLSFLTSPESNYLIFSIGIQI